MIGGMKTGCVRCMHGANPLVWSDEVASFARVSESGVLDLCRFRSRGHLIASVVTATFMLNNGADINGEARTISEIRC